MPELLFWPALLAYGQAVVAYAGNARKPGLYGVLATWGVRLGWLLQAGLLAVQAARAEGFPWDSWAGSLNLFVWLVVGAYLIWGCRPRYRVLGLVVMPLVVALLVVAWLGGGTAEDDPSRYSDLFLVLHVGFVLAAFAGFTLSAALSAVYLWEERRLKRRQASSVLRLRAPALDSLDSLAARTIGVAVPALALGIAAGLARLVDQGGGFDVLMGVTLVTLASYAAFLVLRYWAGWRGRRAALLALGAFALVLLVRLGLPVTHIS